MTEEQIREKACIAYKKWLPKTHPEVIENEDEYEEYSNGLVEGWYGGYELGATENGIQWHDLRKDPNDLPKECRMYFVYKIDGYGVVSMEIMQFNNKHCWCANCQSNVIAWCEIPQLRSSL